MRVSPHSNLQTLARGGGGTQLRHLDAYPTTPRLFAALLRHTGAGAALLPLLVEPAAAALAGLQVAGRRQRPQHTAAFLAALLETSRAAEVVLVERLDRIDDHHHRSVGETAAPGTNPRSSFVHDDGREAGTGEAGEAVEAAGEAGAKAVDLRARVPTADVKDYFLERARRAAAAAAEPNGRATDEPPDSDDEEDDDSPQGPSEHLAASTACLDAEQLREAAAAARLNDQAAAAAAPLLAARHPTVALAALRLVLQATRALTSVARLDQLHQARVVCFAACLPCAAAPRLHS